VVDDDDEDNDYKPSNSSSESSRLSSLSAAPVANTQPRLPLSSSVSNESSLGNTQTTGPIDPMDAGMPARYAKSYTTSSIDRQKRRHELHASPYTQETDRALASHGLMTKRRRNVQEVTCFFITPSYNTKTNEFTRISTTRFNLLIPENLNSQMVRVDRHPCRSSLQAVSLNPII
jgi:hypothetical protein